MVLPDSMATFKSFVAKALNIRTTEPIKNGSGYFFPMYGTGQLRTIRDTATRDGQRTAYQFCPVVTSIVTKKVSAAANGIPYVKNANGETVTGSQAKKLLDWISKIDLNKAYTMNQVFGKAYIWKRTSVGFSGVTSLVVLDGWNVDDNANRDYVLYTEQGKATQIRIPKAELLIWNDKYMNLLNNGEPVKGGSRLVSLKDPVSNIAAVYEGLNMIWTSGGAVGIVSPKPDRMGSMPLTPDEQEQTDRHFSSRYGLQRSKHPVLVSQKPLGWQSTVLPVSQLMYIEGLFENARQVCDCYGVSPMLLGFSQGTTYTNKDAAEKAMYQDAVIPEMDGLCKAINSDKDLGTPGLFVSFDFSTLAILQDDESAKADHDTKIMTNAKTMKDTGLYSDDEVRQYIYDNSKLTLPE